MAPSPWVIVAVLFLARTALAFQFQTVGAVGPLLVDALAIDYALLGTLIGLYMLPGAFLALPGGVLGQRFGARRLVMAGLVLMVAGGALTAWAPGALSLGVGRLASGIGGVLINVLMTKMIADWFSGQRIVTAMSIMVTGWPLGIALGLLLLAPLGEAQGWRAAMAAGTAAAALALACMALFYRDPPGEAGRSASMRFAIGLARREWLLVSLAGCVWGAYNVAYIVLASFSPSYFATRGYSLQQASSLASLIGWLLIPLIPLAGYAADRLGRPYAILVAGLAAAAAGSALIPMVDSPGLAYVLVSIAFGLPGGIIMSLPAGVLQPAHRAAGMGVYFTWYYAAMALLPGLAGLARDLTASAAAPLYFAAAMLIVALGALAAFRGGRTQGRVQGEAG